MITGRSNLAAALGADGRIYAIGGRDPERDFFLTDVQAYDPSTNRWAIVASLPTGRYNLGATAGCDGLIYALGGFAIGFRYSDVVEAYDPVYDQWIAVPPMFVPREGPGAATGGDARIYAIGGNNGRILNTVEAYTP